MKQLRSFAKLRAIHTQKLVPIATHAHTRILEHAVILIGISLRGYPGTIQAFRLMYVHSLTNAVHAECIDPRTNQDNVLDALQESLIQYMNQCKKLGSAPQIWVPNKSALRMWEALCHRLSHTQHHQPLCSILQYITQRHYYAGSQTFLPLSHILKQHWATGLPDTYDDAVETWFQLLSHKAPNKTPHPYTFLNEQQEAHSPIREAVLPILEKETQERASLAQKVLSLFEKKAPPLIPCFIDWWQQDLEYFARFCQNPTSNQPDSPILAAQKFEEREFTQQNYLADLRREDSAYFYGSLLEGHCLEGIIKQIQGYTIRILCNQPIIRAREGDSLANRNDPSDQFRILDSQWTQEGYLVLLRKNFGRLSCSLNSKIQLTPSAMGWSFQAQRRKNISQRLKNRGWIHQEDSV